MTPDTMTAAMWLHLLEKRKPMNAATLSAIAGCTRNRADTILSILATRGAVRAYPDPARKNGRAYSVDAACVLPRGVTLEQVLAAVGNAEAMPVAPELDERETKDRPLPPRGELGYIGRVSSVFAMGAAA